jgi:hypothetical protein
MQYMYLLKDPTLHPLWKRGFGNELGRLFQGIRDIHGTNTCFFVELAKITKDHQTIAYEKNVCDYKPQKNGKERVGLTVGGDILYYSREVANFNTDITTF